MAEQLDPRLEGRLRNALHADADAIPFTIRSAELLRRAGERQEARSRRRLTLIASAAVVAVVVGGAAIASLSRLGGDVGASPSTSPSSLPSTEQLVTAAGPGASVVAAGGGATDSSIGVWELGGIAGRTRLELVIACSGEPIVVGVGTGSGSRETTIATATCDGRIEQIPWVLDGDIANATLLYLHVGQATAFRAIIVDTAGTVPTPVPNPGEPILPANLIGGSLLSRASGAAPGEGTYSSPVPTDAKDLYLIIACSGVGMVHVDLDGVATDIPCTGTSITGFVPPVGGTTTLRVRSEGALRYIMELRAVPGGGAGVRFTPPVATLTAPTPGGSTASVPGFAGCGLGFTLPDGDTASDQCGPSWMPIPDDRALRVAAGTELTLSLPDGWTMTGLDGEITDHAGIAPAGRAPEGAPLVQMDGGSPTVTFEAPQAGDWGVRLNINGQNTDGTRFGVPYYFRVVVTP